jgi:hypothetical protein
MRLKEGVVDKTGEKRKKKNKTSGKAYEGEQLSSIYG